MDSAVLLLANLKTLSKRDAGFTRGRGTEQSFYATTTPTIAQSKQRTPGMQGEQMAFSLLNLQNIFLPLAIGKVPFRERDAAAAPGGQSGDVPEGLCL